MRKIIALIILSVALASLVPVVPQAQALVQRWVQPSGADVAKYRVTTTTTAGLVECWIPTTLNIRRNRNNTFGNVFRCINNFNQSVVLNWSVARDVDGVLGTMTASGSATIPVSTGGSSCVSVTFNNTPNLNDGLAHPVVFMGKTADTANFYVEIYFTGNVLFGGSTGGGC